MTLDDLKKELQSDLPINQTDLQYEAANNPVIYGKWLRYLSDLKMQHKKMQNQKTKALRERLEYYTGRGDDICIDQYSPTELRTIIPGDSLILRADTEAEIINIMIEFCKGCLDAIKNRGYGIKQIVEIRQLESGK